MQCEIGETGLIRKEPFGRTASGEAVDRYVLSSASGMQAAVITYGAALQMLRVPDSGGVLGDITPGFSTVTAYEAHKAHFGAVIGRSCGRVRGGKAAIQGDICQLTRNAGPHHLHGGARGFDKQVWTASEKGRDVLELSLQSPDGEEGYPGALEACVRYRWIGADTLMLEFEAVSTRDTLCNLTTHAYFNLAGHAGGDVLGHSMRVHAERAVELDESALPTGNILPLEGSRRDFRAWRSLRDSSGRPEAFPKSCCFLPAPSGPRLRSAAELWEPVSGRRLELSCTQPALHYYSGYLVKDVPPGKDGAVYGPYCGLCLEPQAVSDGLGRPGLPSPYLEGKTLYRHVILYRFGAGRTPPWEGGNPDDEL